MATVWNGDFCPVDDSSAIMCCGRNVLVVTIMLSFSVGMISDVTCHSQCFVIELSLVSIFWGIWDGLAFDA